jgi:hypothetical protein
VKETALLNDGIKGTHLSELVVRPLVIKKASVREKRDQMSIEREEKKNLRLKLKLVGQIEDQ